MQTIHSASADKWNLVMARDLKADGQFVYAVKSTGIFCRPSCPSRRPRPEKVEFFNTAVEAQKAGYRACRRCLPDGPSLQIQKVEAAKHYIDENLDTTLSLSTVSRHVGMSPFYFQRMFKRVVGISPREYQQARRTNKFKDALQSDTRVTDAIYDAGYGSSSRVYENVSGQLGMTPSTFREKGRGAEIRYTILPTAMGRLLIAATSRGLCSVRFGESDAALVRDLRHDFRAAAIERNDRALKHVAHQVEDLLRSGVDAAQIPLDIQGTAFQQRVWKALRQIPRGKTQSYSEIAAVIGKPKAVRAVAGACASNPVALVVPCHRVVAKNGSLAGYRWGVKRKAALLEAEASSSAFAR